MPIPSLTFDDPIRGLPDQPIPIRYAALATELGPLHFLRMLTEDPCPVDRCFLSEHDPSEMPLPVYEYTGSRIHRPVESEFYRKLFLDHQRTTLKQLLPALPPTHFVWSAGLCDVFLTYVDFYRHRKGVPNSICWKPQLFGVKALIEECVDLSLLNGSTDAYVFKRTGSGTRDIVFAGGTRISVKDSRGLRYLEELLRRPGKTISARDLSAHEHPRGATEALLHQGDHDDADYWDLTIHDGGHAGEILDETAIESYTQNLKMLEEQLAKANKEGSTQTVSLEKQIACIKKELRNGTTRSGRPKRAKPTSKLAYDAVATAIKRAIGDLQAKCPACGGHIKESLEYKRQDGWTYRPTHAPSWKF